jgi:hypothetical protein
MGSVQQAAVLNNEGVRLLGCGDFDGAIQAFQRGLVVMKASSTADPAQPPAAAAVLSNNSESSRSRPQSSLSPQRSHDSNHLAIASHPDASSSCLDPQSSAANLAGLQQQHGLCFVFDRPFLLKTDDESSVVLTSSTVLLFNFALACHQCWMQTGIDDAMRRATELYELTLRLLCDCDCSHQDACGVLKCLVLNNLAHLHYEDCEYQESHYCMSCLRELILCLGCLDHDSAASILSNLEREEIKLNLLHLKPPLTAHAA